MVYSKIISSGSCLPATCILNADLPKELETSDEWISERTGIKKRHIAEKDVMTSDLAVEAIKNALKKCNLKPSDLDGVIVVTCTPDLIMPSTASIVCQKLGINSGFTFDINAACSGFVYGLSVVDGLIKNKTAKRIALVGAEVMSRVVDWSDRSTCVLFGDGAGAFIIEGIEGEEGGGIIASSMGSDSTYKDILYIPGGVGSCNYDAKLIMKGKEVYKHAIDGMYKSLKELCESNKIAVDSIDWFIPHQANQRILVALANKMNVSMDKVVSTIGDHANTSAASIPLAFDEYERLGKIKRGDLLAFTAFGAGLAWGSSIVVY